MVITKIEDINGGDGTVSDIKGNDKVNSQDVFTDSAVISKLNSIIKTGDNNNPVIYIVIAITTLVAIGVLFVNSKKIKN